MLSWRGIWRDKALFDECSLEVPLEISSHICPDGTKPLL